METGQVAFRVTTERLTEISQNIDGSIQKLRTDMEKMGNEVQQSSNYWEGEAGETCRMAFREFNDEIETMLARLNEHVVDLQKIAGIYEQSETTSLSEADALPEDVII